MLPGILGKKIGMTHVFNEDGKMVPVTVVQAGPMYVTQIKTEATDGYTSVQVGYDEISDKNLTFPKHGHLKKAGLTTNVRTLKEFRVHSVEGLELGQKIEAGIFEVGEVVTVTGRSKGRGFAGGVKRYHFKGQQMTHGFMTHRRPLSNGATGPQRVFKGSRRPGHMGDDQVTQKGLKVVGVDLERNLLLIDGSVPGPNGAMVIVNRSSTTIKIPTTRGNRSK
ncbi:MAG: 50S ribosomal protein L3 [Armatimonadota bacterium]